MKYEQSVERRVEVAGRRVSLLLLFLTLVPVGRTDAGYYTITPIATDNTPIGPNNEGFRDFGIPTINNHGDIAFMAVTDRWFFNPLTGWGNMTGVFVGNGGAVTTIADSDAGSAFTGFGTISSAIPSINNHGDVAFFANTTTGAKGIFRRSGTTITTIADTATPYSFGTLSRVEMATSMNDSGTVAFESQMNSFTNNGVFKGSGGAPTLVADRNDSPLKSLGTPAITSNGTVAFPAYLDAGGNGYFTGPNPTTDTLVDSNISGLNRILTTGATAINDTGTLVYVARLTATNNAALVMSQGNSHGVIADAANGPYSGFFTSNGSGPSINNNDDLAFVASTDANKMGIYTGPDPLRDAVIEVNDSLFGSTLQGTNLGISSQAINDAGQIVFRGRLNGTFLDFIARADPIRGSLPANPLLPDAGSPAGVFDFNLTLTGNGLGVVDPIFIDPDIAVGYDYELTGAGDPLITSVLLPEGVGDGAYELWLWNGSDWMFDQTLTGGVGHTFAAAGVDRFRILGIEPEAMLDASDPLAFVTGLTFASGSTAIGLTMTPLVPEPTSIALFALAGLAAVRRRR